MKRSLHSVAGILLARSWAAGSQAPCWLPAAARAYAQHASSTQQSACRGPSSSAAPSSLRSWPALPSTQALAAAGCCGLALRTRLQLLLSDALGSHPSDTPAPHSTPISSSSSTGHGNAQDAQPLLLSADSSSGAGAGAASSSSQGSSSRSQTSLARLGASMAASLGLGLASAAAAPAGFAVAQFQPSWDRMDRNWHNNKWNFFGRDRRVTEILMGVNVGMFALQKIYPGLVFRLARVNHLVSQGEFWRLLTPALVHADLFHLAINTASLYLLGPSVEALLGRQRFLATYAFSALAGNGLAWWMGSTGFTMAVGASSSISGLFGAYVAFRWLNRHRYGLGGEDIVWLAQIVGINVLIQIGSHSVDGWSHLGGALGGAAMVALLGPRPGRW